CTLALSPNPVARTYSPCAGIGACSPLPFDFAACRGDPSSTREGTAPVEPMVSCKGTVQLLPSAWNSSRPVSSADDFPATNPLSLVSSCLSRVACEPESESPLRCFSNRLTRMPSLATQSIFCSPMLWFQSLPSFVSSRPCASLRGTPEWCR